MSPPMPVMCGSVTLSTAAAATAASMALPPRRSTSRPAAEASGWLVATAPLRAWTVERPAMEVGRWARRGSAAPGSMASGAATAPTTALRVIRDTWAPASWCGARAGTVACGRGERVKTLEPLRTRCRRRLVPGHPASCRSARSAPTVHRNAFADGGAHARDAARTSIYPGAPDGSVTCRNDHAVATRLNAFVTASNLDPDLRSPAGEPRSRRPATPARGAPPP